MGTLGWEIKIWLVSCDFWPLNQDSASDGDSQLLDLDSDHECGLLVDGCGLLAGKSGPWAGELGLGW